jgi:hypothetical protein
MHKKTLKAQKEHEVSAVSRYNNFKTFFDNLCNWREECLKGAESNC